MNRISNELLCGISNDHFVEKPISLNCGHNCCKDCIQKLKIKTFKCSLCGRISEKDLSKEKESVSVKNLIKTRLNELVEKLENKTSEGLGKLKSKYY